MRRFVTYLLLMCSSVLLVAVWFHSAQAAPEATAAAAAPTPVIVSVLTEVVKLVVAIATPLLLYLAHKGIGIFEDKAGIDIPQQEEDLVDKWVEQGVHLAEERAAQFLRAHEQKMTGGSKLETAFDFAWEQIQRTGVLDWSRERLLAKIEAKVNYKRSPFMLARPAPIASGIVPAVPPPLPPAK